MGAVMGYSEQHTLLLMTSDEEVEAFLNVSLSNRVSRYTSSGLVHATCIVSHNATSEAAKSKITVSRLQLASLT